MSKKDSWKHVFCIEGLWDSDLRSTITIKPGLDLLQTNGLKYIYKDAATKEELNFYLKKFKQKRYSDYPILYLGFHGKEQLIELSNGSVSIEDLGKTLKGACKNKVVILASCSTLNTTKKGIEAFREITQSLAVIGYKSDVDWFEATAFEIMLIDVLYHNAFDGRGLKGIIKKFKELNKRFPKIGATIHPNS